MQHFTCTAVYREGHVVVKIMVMLEMIIVMMAIMVIVVVIY